MVRVGGSGSFRRRLMELGLVPGTRVEIRGVAPLGDPLELLVRGASLSIRRADASAVEVVAEAPSELALEPRHETASELVQTGVARGAP